MEHRGIRYTIRTGIVRQTWSVAIHPSGVGAIEKPFKGSRPAAELRAHSMIDRWLQEHQRVRAPALGQTSS
jgi:hypothetical protein